MPLTLPGLGANNQNRYLDDSVGNLNYDLNEQQQGLLASQIGLIAQSAGVNAGEAFRTGGAGGAARRNQMLLQGGTNQALADASGRDLFARQDLEAQGLRLQNALGAEQARQADAANEVARQNAAVAAAAQRESARQFDASQAFRERQTDQENRFQSRALSLQRRGLGNQTNQQMLELIFGSALESGVNPLDMPDVINELMRRFM